MSLSQFLRSNDPEITGIGRALTIHQRAIEKLQDQYLYLKTRLSASQERTTTGGGVEPPETGDLADLTARVSKLESKVTGLSGDITTLTSRFTELSTSVDEANAATAARFDALEAVVTPLTEIPEQMNAGFSAVNTRIDELAASIGGMDESIVGMQNDIAVLTEAVNVIEVTLANSKVSLQGLTRVADLASVRGNRNTLTLRRILVTEKGVEDFDRILDPMYGELSFYVNGIMDKPEYSGLGMTLSQPFEEPIDHHGFTDDWTYESAYLPTTGGFQVHGSVLAPIWNRDTSLFELKKVSRPAHEVLPDSSFAIVAKATYGTLSVQVGDPLDPQSHDFPFYTEDLGYQDAVIVWCGLVRADQDVPEYRVEFWQPLTSPLPETTSDAQGLPVEFERICTFLGRMIVPRPHIVPTGTTIRSMEAIGGPNVLIVPDSDLAPNASFIEVIFDPIPLICPRNYQEMGVTSSEDPNYVDDLDLQIYGMRFNPSYYKSVYQATALSAQKVAATARAEIREVKESVPIDSPFIEMMASLIQEVTGLATSLWTLQKTAVKSFNVSIFASDGDTSEASVNLPGIYDDGLDVIPIAGIEYHRQSDSTDDGNQIFYVTPEFYPEGYDETNFQWNPTELVIMPNSRKNSSVTSRGVTYTWEWVGTFFDFHRNASSMEILNATARSEDFLETTTLDYTLIPYDAISDYAPSVRLTVQWQGIPGTTAAATPGVFSITTAYSTHEVVMTPGAPLVDASGLTTIIFDSPPIPMGTTTINSLVNHRVDGEPTLPYASEDFQEWTQIYDTSGYCMYARAHEREPGFIEYNIDVAYGYPSLTAVIGYKKEYTVDCVLPGPDNVCDWATITAPTVTYTSNSEVDEDNNIYYDATALQEKVAIMKIQLDNAAIHRELEDLDQRVAYIEEHSNPSLLGFLGAMSLTVASFAAPGVLLTTSLIAGTALTVADAAVQGDVLKAVGWSMGCLLHSRTYLRAVGGKGVNAISNTAKDLTSHYFRDIMPFPWRGKRETNIPFTDSAMKKRSDETTFNANVIGASDYTDRDPEGVLQNGNPIPVTSEMLTGVGASDSKGTIAILGSGMNSGDPRLAMYEAMQENILAHKNDPGVVGFIADSIFRNTSQPEHQALSISQPLNVMGPAGLFPAEIRMTVGLGHGPQPNQHAEYLFKIGSQGVGRVGGPDHYTRKGAGMEGAIILKGGGTVEDPYAPESVLTLHAAKGTVDIPDDEIEAERVYNLRQAHMVYDEEIVQFPSYDAVLPSVNPSVANKMMINTVNNHRDRAALVRDIKDCQVTPEAFAVLSTWMEREGGIRDNWLYARVNGNCNNFAKELQDLIVTGTVRKPSNLPNAFVLEFLAAQTVARSREITFLELVNLQRAFVKHGLDSIDATPRGA